MYFRILQIFIFSSAGQPGWIRFCIFSNYLCDFYLEKRKRLSPAYTQQLCHPIYHSGFCLWEVVCFLNLFLIFLKRERCLNPIANRPKQNCAADTCLLFMQCASAFLHYYPEYIASAGWNVGEQNESTKPWKWQQCFPFPAGYRKGYFALVSFSSISYHQMLDHKDW